MREDARLPVRFACAEDARAGIAECAARERGQRAVGRGGEELHADAIQGCGREPGRRRQGRLQLCAEDRGDVCAPLVDCQGKESRGQGSLLYKIFEVQAVLSIFVGGLAAYNVIYPSEGPTIARMLGMWSVWALAVPSLRARDCDNDEKDALNLLFIAIPLLNVTLPLVWRSFAAVFSADVLMLAGVYFWKLGGLPAGGVFTDSDAE